MTEYCVLKDSIDRNYGLYDWLCLSEKNEDNIKTLGVIYDDKSIFRIDIADHYCENDKFKKEYGSYGFSYSTYYVPDKSESRIRFYEHHDPKPNKFAYEVLMGLLNECIKYRKTSERKVKFEVPGVFFEDGKYRYDYDLELLLSLVEEKYNRLEEDIEIEDIQKDKVRIFDIQKLISIFKKDNKKR